jgi:ATP-binding cassette subfamily B protein
MGVNPRPRFSVPEVIQTSAMDCGPAVLKAVLGGFGVSVSYGRVREACQTAVDGTSIDRVQDILSAFGLHAVQTIVPADTFALPEAQVLPAVVVVQIPNAGRHYIIVWRRLGPFVQIMNPASGRRWIRERDLTGTFYNHTHPVPLADWRRWAEASTGLLRARLARLGVSAGSAAELVEAACAPPGWRGLAGLDAALRMVQSLRAAGVLRRASAGPVVARVFRLAQDEADPTRVIPAAYWRVQDGGVERPDSLLVSGVVLVRVGAPRAAPGGAAAPARELPRELAAAVEQAAERPLRDIGREVRADGVSAPAVLGVGLTALAAGFLVESLVLRRLIDLGADLGSSATRLAALGALLAFVLLMGALEWPVGALALGLGRRLEARLRLAFARKLPRLEDRYFSSRLASDMAERSHSLHLLRSLPASLEAVARSGVLVLLTTVGLVWAWPAAAPAAIALAAVATLLPPAFQPLLAERDMRVRVLHGSLTRFYLDSLLGLVPLRGHAAERNLRRAYEAQLVEWSRAGLSLLGAGVTLRAAQAGLGTAVLAWLFLDFHASRDAGAALLFTYWALMLPEFGQQLAFAIQQYPAARNVALRLMEPLGAPEATPRDAAGVGAPAAAATGLALRFEALSLDLGGHEVLHEIDLVIEPGQHVALVGPSGAGKSSLLGLVLGLYRPARGRLLIDGQPLEALDVHALRRLIAWVDPAVQLWNRSLLDNLGYGNLATGNPAALSRRLATVVDEADLQEVLLRLPEGYQTRLGEGGALVSGGEGQRVRLARAMLRPGVRLAVLDEPFRGLDRAQRRLRLASARRRWARATLLCATHDVDEARAFDRVGVVEAGRLVEYGAPDELLARPGSRYAALLQADEQVRRGQWRDVPWRRLRVERGHVLDAQAEEPWTSSRR